MIDIALEQSTSGYDISITDGDLTSVDSFETAIYVSLFSDARASEDQVFLPQARRGWICDVASPIEDQLYGSHLWLLEQRRLTQSTLNEAINYARLGLQWMIDQGQALNIEVTGEIVAGSGIALNIAVTSYTGETQNAYVRLWENTINGN